VWGRIGTEGEEIRHEDLEAITEGAVLSRGLGRSYGDSSLPPSSHPVAVNTTLSDRILAFDRGTGVITTEAGHSLHDLNWTLLTKGWFTPVTPGTQYVTIGGMVASDIHGKNHHVAGTFGRHVLSLRMRLANDTIVTCSREEMSDLFLATLGGMGLTGHILEVTFRMERVPTPWIWQETQRVQNLDEFLTALDTAARDWPMTVGWIDCLSSGKSMGRGILMKGRWAQPDEAPARAPVQRPRITFPMELPGWVLGRLSVRAFNTTYYHQHIPKLRAGIVHPEPFFYPLDTVRRWNLMYGKRGFIQYQCVLPKSGMPDNARGFLELLTTLGGASFLSVIKDCGEEGDGILSFPMLGISVALDIPMRDGTQQIVDALNDFVIANGGRIYLSKDALTRGHDYLAMDPRVDRFLEVRRKYDPQLRIRSVQSIRIFGDPP
jgi:FAD/FMN-containing dehydrogenase